LINSTWTGARRQVHRNKVWSGTTVEPPGLTG
jgi:hypothetical protein